eukprot:739240-Hanusia_phi.AAC.3
METLNEKRLSTSSWVQLSGRKPLLVGRSKRISILSEEEGDAEGAVELGSAGDDRSCDLGHAAKVARGLERPDESVCLPHARERVGRAADRRRSSSRRVLYDDAQSLGVDPEAIVEEPEREVEREEPSQLVLAYELGQPSLVGVVAEEEGQGVPVAVLVVEDGRSLSDDGKDFEWGGTEVSLQSRRRGRVGGGLRGEVADVSGGVDLEEELTDDGIACPLCVFHRDGERLPVVPCPLVVRADGARKDEDRVDLLLRERAVSDRSLPHSLLPTTSQHTSLTSEVGVFAELDLDAVVRPEEGVRRYRAGPEQRVDEHQRGPEVSGERRGVAEARLRPRQLGDGHVRGIEDEAWGSGERRLECSLAADDQVSYRGGGGAGDALDGEGELGARIPGAEDRTQVLREVEHGEDDVVGDPGVGRVSSLIRRLRETQDDHVQEAVYLVDACWILPGHHGDVRDRLAEVPRQSRGLADVAAGKDGDASGPDPDLRSGDVEDSDLDHAAVLLPLTRIVGPDRVGEGEEGVNLSLVEDGGEVSLVGLPRESDIQRVSRPVHCRRGEDRDRRRTKSGRGQNSFPSHPRPSCTDPPL